MAYLIQQGFEGTGYDNSESWTEFGTGIDPDYTGVVIAGSQSLRILCAASSGKTTSPAFTAQSDAWAYFRLRMVSLPAATAIVSRFMSGATEIARLRINVSGQLQVRPTGGTELTTTDALSTGVDYHIWYHYVAGSGANGFMSVGFSTDGVKPTSGNSYRESTNGTGTGTLDRIEFGLTSSGTVEMVYDTVLVADTEIGDNPGAGGGLLMPVAMHHYRNQKQS